jgi:hypothetical protein
MEKQTKMKSSTFDLFIGDTRSACSDKLGSSIKLLGTEVVTDIPSEDLYVQIPGFDTRKTSSGLKYTFSFQRDKRVPSQFNLSCNGTTIHRYKGYANPHEMACFDQDEKRIYPRDLILHVETVFTGCIVM